MYIHVNAYIHTYYMHLCTHTLPARRTPRQGHEMRYKLTRDSPQHASKEGGRVALLLQWVWKCMGFCMMYVYMNEITCKFMHICVNSPSTLWQRVAWFSCAQRNKTWSILNHLCVFVLQWVRGYFLWGMFLPEQFFCQDILFITIQQKVIWCWQSTNHTRNRSTHTYMK